MINKLATKSEQRTHNEIRTYFNTIILYAFEHKIIISIQTKNLFVFLVNDTKIYAYVS